MTWLGRLGWAVVDNVTNLVTIPTLDDRAFKQKMSLFITILQYFEPFLDEEEGQATITVLGSSVLSIRDE